MSSGEQELHVRCARAVSAAAGGGGALDVVRLKEALRIMPRDDGLPPRSDTAPSTTSFAPTDFQVSFRPSCDSFRCFLLRLERPKSCL